MVGQEPHGALQTLTIARATPFSFVFYGKVIPSYTMASTVGEMLAQTDEIKEAGIVQQTIAGREGWLACQGVGDSHQPGECSDCVVE